MIRRQGSAAGASPAPPRRRRSGLVLLLAVAAMFLSAESSRPAAAQAPSVLVTRVDGVITPVIADHLVETLERIERDGHDALVVELDTPGGLDTSMRDIVQAFLNARAPVIVHVAPQGARAASAGAIITFAAHVAAMAPGTTIGAATPIDIEGGDLAQKVINDAAAYVESIAERRGRDVEFAVATVREGRSAPASEALELGVIDLIAPDRASLLDQLDGRQIQLSAGRAVTLRTSGAEVVETELGTFRSILQWLADPNLAVLFISIGTLAILYELANPGFGGGAIVGVILLVLAFTALSVLPVNASGAILLVLAAFLFVAELFAPGIGVFAAGGTIALVLGGLFLFRGPIGVNPASLLPTALLLGTVTIALGRMVWRTRRLIGSTGGDLIVGSRGVVATAERGESQLFLHGSWWSARPRRGTLRPGQRVRVVEMDGLRLIVEPEEQIAEPIEAEEEER